MNIYQASSFNYPTNIIDMINTDKCDVKLVANAATFKSKTITNGSELGRPDVMIKCKGKYTSDALVKLFSSNQGTKIFPPFGNAPYKYNNKLMIGFGKYDASSSDFIKAYLFSKAIGIASDFMIASRVLELDISKYKTDKEFVDAVNEKLGKKADEDLEEFLAYAHSTQPSVITETNEFRGLIDVIGDHLKEALKTCPGFKTNETATFMLKNWKSTKNPFKVAEVDVKDRKTNEMITLTTSTASLVFTTKTPTSTSEFYCTKEVKGKKLITLTTDNMPSYVEKKSMCNFICKVTLDWRKFTTGVTNGVKLEVRQFICKPFEQKNEVIMFDDDDENNDNSDGWEEYNDSFEHICDVDDGIPADSVIDSSDY